MSSLSFQLERYGLGKYSELFAEHSIDLDVLPDLTDADLEKLGIPLGDRRRILKMATQLTVDEKGPAPARGRQAERRQLTVMFADLVDSTKFAARLDPEDMKDVIARYQKAVGDEVARFGGYVAKPLGDGLLVYFGWPQAHEDDAERALRSGLAAVAAVRRLKGPTGEALATRMGIATGEVVVGDFVGKGVEEEGAVVGETPNLAARLQSIAGENSVVVAEQTLRLVGRQFVFSDLGIHHLKGFDEPVRAWRVDGEGAVESRFDALHAGHLGKFIGREHEIGFLLERFDEAREGDGQAVLISGEAGIGKSRLVSEFVARLAAGATDRFAYQGSPLHVNTPLYPVTHQLELRVGLEADDSPDAKIRRLQAAIPCETERDRAALSFLAELMSLSGESRPESSSEQREAALDLLASMIVRESKRSPVLVVFEDAHWVDATTQELVGRLIEQLLDRRLLVLVTYRPEFAPPWAQHANVGTLTLSRLGRRHSQAIVAALTTASDGLSEEAAREIIQKSDGIPLFMEELVGSAVESMRSSEDGGIRIPSTLRDSLSARLDRLGSAKQVAQIAAAYGREFSSSLLAATLARAETELAEDLDKLVAIGVVFRMSGTLDRFMFKHALLRDAAYESLLKSKRAEIHQRIVEVLLRDRPEMAETEPELLATHLARAGDTAGAAECWRKAGHLALRNSAYREAIGAFKNALPLFSDDDASARADTNRAIASAYFAVGDHKSVRQHLEHAASDAEGADDRVMMAEIAVQQSHDLIHYGGSLTDAVRFGERALEIADRLDDDALAYGARFSLGQAAWIGGNFADAIGFLTANLPENLRDPERVRDFGTAGSLIMDSVSILGATCAYLGEFDRAFGFLDRALALASDGAFDVSVVQYHLTRAHLQRRDAATALPLARAAMRHAAEAGLTFTVPWLRGILGYALAFTGNVEEAIALLEKAVQESDAMHQPTSNVRARVFLAEVLAPDDPEHALEVAEPGLSKARAIGYRAQEAELLRIKAAALASADGVRAEEFARQGLNLARELGMRPEQAHAERVLGDILGSQGKTAAAGEHVERAAALYHELGMASRVEGPA